MQDIDPSKTPPENNLTLVKATEDEQLVDETLYKGLVELLFCIAKQTRPDLMWILNLLFQFMDKQANSHWLAGKRVCRYLQASKFLKLV